MPCPTQLIIQGLNFSGCLIPMSLRFFLSQDSNKAHTMRLIHPPCIALPPSSFCSCYLFVEEIGSFVLCCSLVCVLQSAFKVVVNMFSWSVSLNLFLDLEGQSNFFGCGGGKEHFIAVLYTPGITQCSYFSLWC